ncbi:MAG: glycoside hydrolase family 127 protein, partial [Verrucomicrobiales bacterium]|nr:glycoside hydrolase family 127 protein [Verrucomicrobiales bacterium]
LNEALDRHPLFDWGKFRWFEGAIAVHYLYERTGEPWLLALAKKLHAQGFDYGAFHASPDSTSPTPRRGLWTWEKHVVNTAMALKAGPIAWRMTGQGSDLRETARLLEHLDRYHGQANGMFSGDECLSGRNPLQGTELCAVVEALYSLELAVAASGDAALADRLERIAFNALPATFAPDMWSHQYDQQANQVQCTVNPDHMWSTNGPESNVFGLEPNFGCCTANLHQGWPKFAAHLWMSAPSNGLALVAYAPSVVRFSPSGVAVTARLTTDYPFRDEAKVTVTTDRPVRFPLLLRVPAWAEGATIRVGDREARPMRPGTFHRVSREWSGTVEITLRFPMSVATRRRYNGAVSVERGPLVYALRVGESWNRIHADQPHRELPHGDFEVHGTSPWNYGLLVNEDDPSKSFAFEERPVGERPFSPEGAGVQARAKGRRLPQWKLEHGWAGETPVSPQTSNEPIEELTLLPYGCAKLRVTEFPRLKG